jgi:hypothetical protein
MMRLRRALAGMLMTLMATAAVLTVAQPAAAAVPDRCAQYGWESGRVVHVTNDSNGGGADVDATICFVDKGDGSGAALVLVFFEVTDTKANGAGATIRMEWTDYDGVMQYDVPIEAHRAWSLGEVVNGDWHYDYGVKNFYVRACLTNAANEAHHCGGKA